MKNQIINKKMNTTMVIAMTILVVGILGGIVSLFQNQSKFNLTVTSVQDRTNKEKEISNNTTGHLDNKISIGIYGQAQPLLINPAGLKFGVNFSDFSLLKNIPDATLQLNDSYSGVKVPNAIQGDYILELKGPVEEDVNINIYFYDNPNQKMYEIAKKLHYYEDKKTIIKFKISFDEKNYVYFIEDVASITNLDASNLNGYANLRWGHEGQADYYNIYKGRDGADFRFIEKTTNTTINTSTEWCENENCQLYFTVTAVKNDKESSFSNFVRNFEN